MLLPWWHRSCRTAGGYPRILVAASLSALIRAVLGCIQVSNQLCPALAFGDGYRCSMNVCDVGSLIRDALRQAPRD